MAQRRDKEGREINPPYVGESMSEYTKARAGKMSSAEQAKIEARIGEASKKTRMVRETARIRPKIAAHRAQRRKIIASRKAY